MEENHSERIKVVVVKEESNERSYTEGRKS